MNETIAKDAFSDATAPDASVAQCVYARLLTRCVDTSTIHR
jgi:hypothetical protein